MERANQCKLLFQLDVFQIQIVHRTKLVSMIFVEIHALVHRMPFAVSKITSQFAHANKDTMDNQRFNVFILVVVPMMNVQQHMHALIDNVYLFVLAMEAHAVKRLNALELIIMPFVNVKLVLSVIQRLDVK